MWEWFFAPFRHRDWWDILNSSIVATTLSSAVGILLATRVGQVAHENRAAEKAKQRAERDESRAEDELAPDVENVDESEPGAAPNPAPAAGATATPNVASAAPQPIDEAAKRRFDRAARAIRVLKDYVDARADRVRDGRVKRKYDNISRRDYRVITTAIGNDGGLSDPVLSDLTAAFERWRSFRTGKGVVSERVATEYEALAKKYAVTPSKPDQWRPKKAQSVEW